MVCVEVVIVDVATEINHGHGIGKRNTSTRGKKQTLLILFSIMIIYHQSVIEAAAIYAFVAQRWQAEGPQFPSSFPPNTFQWLPRKHAHKGMP